MTTSMAGVGIGCRRIRWIRGVALAVCLAAGMARAAEPADAPQQRADVSTTATGRNEALRREWARVAELRSRYRADQSRIIAEQQWGIKIAGLSLSAGGNMVDFRYRVVDPVKAAQLTNASIKPALLEPMSGAKLIVPDTSSVGQLRQTVEKPIRGRIYFMLFANTQHRVKSGDKVTITAGDFRVEDIIVE